MVLVTSGISDIFEQLCRIGEGDLLIGISFPRYTNRTIEAMNFARRPGRFPDRHHRRPPVSPPRLR